MVKKFKQFIKEEAISGTELVGNIGPSYGDTDLKNTTINYNDTNIIFCDIDNKFYNIDDYNSMYQDYLKMNGKPLNGFNIENILTILQVINPDLF